MKLSELAYYVVKNVKYLDDYGFTYEAFKAGGYDGDQDYSNSINNALAPINEAIHRLSDRDKVAFQSVEGLGVADGCLLDLSELRDETGERAIRVKKIKSVYGRSKGSYRALAFRELGKRKVLLLTPLEKGEAVGIQVSEDIPAFRRGDFSHFEDSDGTVTETDVDLFDYGLSETACDYIIEYAQGKLQEQIAPELANMHLTRAEQYFDDLETYSTPLYQSQVERKFRI